MTNLKYILIGVAVAALILFFYWYNKSKVIDKKTCFDLVNSSDPVVFGPSYWKAFHSLSHKIPCDSCRTYAEKFMIFFHDVINLKTGKPLFDSANYYYILQTIPTGK